MSIALLRLGLLTAFLLLGRRPLGAQSPSILSPAGPAQNVICIVWDPSLSEEATGYCVCWGLRPEDCTNHLDVGNVTAVSLAFAGLRTNVTYHLAIVARNDSGEKSPPSNMIQCSVSGMEMVPDSQEPSVEIANPAIPVPPRLPGLLIQVWQGDSVRVEATTNFLDWEATFTTNCASDGMISIEPPYSPNYPQRFFRLVRE